MQKEVILDRASDPLAYAFPLTVVASKPIRNQFFKEKLSQSHINLGSLAETHPIPMYALHCNIFVSRSSIRKSGGSSYDQESEQFVDSLFANRVPWSRASWYLKVLMMSGQNYENKKDRV